MPKAFLNRIAQIALAIAVLTLLAVGAVCYRSLVLSGESGGRVRHTYEVLEGLQGLLAASQGGDAMARAFAWTGAESDLLAWQAEISTLRADEAALGLRLAGDPQQRRHLANLGKLLDKQVQFGQRIVDFRRTMGPAGAAAAIAAGSSRGFTAEVAVAADLLRTEEWRALALRDAEAKRSLRQAKAVLIAGDLLGILVVVAAFLSVRRDSARRRSVEQALRESEERYRGLLEAAPDGMVVVNAAGEIVLLNAQAENQFGYRRDELLGQKVTSLIPQGFAERLIADGTRTAAEALAQQIGTGIELNGRRRNGSTFPIEIMLSPLDGRTGILVTAAIRDISVRKAAELHLAQMESRYRGLLEAAPDAMVVVNIAGEIVLLNVQAEKQFGYRRDELLGRQVRSIIPEGFAERLVADALRSSEDALAQQIGTGIELSGRRRNGTCFPIEIMLSPLEGAEGMLVTAAIRDISTRKAAEAELLQKVEELKRSNEELGQFAYIASHDLQEPLRMVASYTQLLSRRYKGRLDADADEFIAFAVDGASRMQRLIQDLLAYSRVGTKGKELQETASGRALAQALVNLRAAVEASGAEVTHDSLPVVLADDSQLVQLFQNLVGNAIKYQGPGIPRVHVSAEKSASGRWLFAVRDNGLGIDPQYFERIFGMFQRLHKREEFAGTGIGLAICRKIAERHGGAIEVESEPGQGATFRFTLAGIESEAGMARAEAPCV
jgi:PAS domain S-box-containing protein